MGTTDDAQDAGEAEDDPALIVVDPNKEVGREKRSLDVDALAIFPDLLGLAGGEKRFDLAHGEETADGRFAPGHGVEREPAKSLLRGRGEKRCVFELANRVGGQFLSLCEPVSTLSAG
jgi:hypothetical protein